MRYTRHALVALTVPLLVISSFAAISSSTAPAARATTQPVVGAIRWDGQVGDDAIGDLSGVGPEEERALSADKWHYRVPFYATVGSNTVSMDGATQQVIDQEIEYAKAAGLSYWAFDWYGDETGLQTARELYLSSPYHNDLNWSAILFTHPLSSADEQSLVSDFQQSNYQKVDGGRPLLYAFDYPDLVDPAQINRIRQETVTEMGVQPYVVALEFSAGAAASFASQIGADAISSYASSGSDHEPYSSMAAAEAANWDAYSATGYPVVPWVTQGWDPQPRIQLNPPYAYASYASNSGVTASSPSELAAQLQKAINWDTAHLTAAPAQAVLMYAWNEFSEGGYIAPTKSGSGINLDYLDAIKGVLTPTSADSGTLDTSPFVTSVAAGTLRSNYSDYVGLQFSTGNAPVTITELGRYYVPGNSGTHVLKLVAAADDSDVGSTVINMAAGSPDGSGFKYAPLSQSVTLPANTTYYLLSAELSGGDQWYDLDSTVGTSSIATVDAAVYRRLGSDNQPVITSMVNSSGGPGHSYGPVTFRYASAPNLALNKPATASSEWDSSQGPANAVDGDLSTDWQGGPSLAFDQQWLQVDLQAMTTFDQVAISEYLDDRTTSFDIQYWNGSSWQIAYQGGSIGTDFVAKFPPVTGSAVRLDFTGGNYTPIIFEFEVHNV